MLAEQLYAFYKTDKIRFIINITFCLVYPIQEILLPYLYGKVIDSASSQNTSKMLLPFIYLAGVLVAVQIVHLLSDMSDASFNPALQNSIRKNLLNKIFEKYEFNFHELNSGDVISKLLKTPQCITTLFERIKNYIIPSIITFISAIGFFTYHDKFLGITLLITILCFSYSTIGSPNFCNKIANQKDKNSETLYSQIDDVLHNMIAVYTNNKQQSELKRLENYENIFTDSYKKTMLCSIKSRMWVVPITIIFLCIFVYRCFTMIRIKKMKVSVFVSLFVMLLYILSSMLTLTEQVRDMVFDWSCMSGLDEFNKIMKENYKENTNNKNVPNSGIFIDNIDFKYTSKKSAITNLNLHLRKNEKICVIGNNGSGKSTLLKLILKLIVPNKGSIYLNGISYNNIAMKDIRKIIKYVPQSPSLFNRSILENIKYNNPSITDQDVKNTIHELGLDHKFLPLENGLNTNVGIHGSFLSGGQRQLIYCLRVLLSHPDIIILDEPTSALDTKYKKLLTNLLDKFMKNKMIIFVSHDEFMINYATRKIEMLKGKVIRDETNNHYY